MEIKASAPRGKDLRDVCLKIELKAQSEAEQKWLTAVYMHVVHDGPEPGPRPAWSS